VIAGWSPSGASVAGRRTVMRWSSLSACDCLSTDPTDPNWADKSARCQPLTCARMGDVNREAIAWTGLRLSPQRSSGQWGRSGHERG
jgi:hypothetical protein